jgi:hypothetical protein
MYDIMKQYRKFYTPYRTFLAQETLSEWLSLAQDMMIVLYSL